MPGAAMPGMAAYRVLGKRFAVLCFGGAELIVPVNAQSHDSRVELIVPVSPQSQDSHGKLISP